MCRYALPINVLVDEQVVDEHLCTLLSELLKLLIWSTAARSICIVGLGEDLNGAKLNRLFV